MFKCVVILCLFSYKNPSFLAKGLLSQRSRGKLLSQGMAFQLLKALAESELNLENGTDIQLTRYNPNYDFGVEPALFVKIIQESFPQMSF